MAPGDPEREATADRAANGIPVDPVTWGTFQELADQYGVARPRSLQEGASRS